jgi:hypothetical protein
VEACEINLTERTRIDNCFKSVFTKLFCTYSKDIIRSCQFYTGCLPLTYLIDQRILCFRRKLYDFKDINPVVYFLFSIASNEFNICASKYDVNPEDSTFCIKNKIWNCFELSVKSVNA